MSGGLVSAIVGRIADFVLQKVQPILKPLYYRAINKRFKMQLRLVLCFNLPDDALELIARAIATLADVLAKWRKVRHMTSTRTNLQVTYEDFQAPILVRITPSPTSPGRIDELEAVIELLGTLDLRYNEPVEIATYIDTLNLVRDELAKAFGVPGYQNYSAILIRKEGVEEWKEVRSLTDEKGLEVKIGEKQIHLHGSQFARASTLVRRYVAM